MHELGAPTHGHPRCGPRRRERRGCEGTLECGVSHLLAALEGGPPLYWPHGLGTRKRAVGYDVGSVAHATKKGVAIAAGARTGQNCSGSILRSGVVVTHLRHYTRFAGPRFEGLWR